ncbi:hypothetical protein OB955_24145 [Halobacteria archaeon AArc-m2/3/4]|uniref:Small CPxCG-related zinc finger protein n=1 Tax=Natronoglomus mannanivorans TaxID=2979990 RepID=A0ABT2QLG5_9EURY|nr:hypothetical protein [Halobacteria archaeon AArc-m2/3/4]
MDPLTALVVLVVLAITPAVLFLLFWEFLVYLRDDALIEELRYEHGFEIDPTELTGFSALRAGPSDRETPTVVRCPSCGEQALDEHDVCVVCGDSLE